MVRCALLLSAALLAVSCKKADSKEVPAANAGDSRVAMKDPPVADGSGSEGVGAVKEADAAAPGSGTAAVESGSGDIPRGTGDKGKGGNPVDPKGAQTSTGDDSFTLTITAPDAVAAGSAATAKLTVKPGKGYHMNEEFPTSLKFEPPAGCTLAKAELEAEDAVEFDKDHLVFDVACTPASAGTTNVSGKLKFAVCTDSTCDPKRQAISFAVAAK